MALAVSEEHRWLVAQLERLAEWAGQQNASNAFAEQVRHWAYATISDLDRPIPEREP